MSYKTILLILFFIKIQNISWSQQNPENSKIELEFKIDSIVNNAIIQRAFPGCVVYASQFGTPFFTKSYGYHTYDSLEATQTTDIFDLASITKVAGSTLALMKLYEQGYFALEDPIGKYIDGLGRQIGSVTFREVLAHQSGLESWIKYYDRFKKKNGQYIRKTLADNYSVDYPYKIGRNLYLYKDYQNKILKEIKRSKLDSRKEYRYSGLFFYLVPQLVKKLSGIDFEDYLKVNFYDSIGAQTLCFSPIDKFELDAIVPTEIDTFFRMESIHATVHDEGAILMNGVSGNAGLFGNAIDLAKIFIMLTADGFYNQQQYLKSSTLQLFTTYQYPNNENRRGLGFDKPLLVYDSLKSSVAQSVSIASFGHTGYTGTLVWADPKNGLVFIFLSNRVYPTRANTGIYDLNVRPAIHELLYDFLNNEQNGK